MRKWRSADSCYSERLADVAEPHRRVLPRSPNLFIIYLSEFFPPRQGSACQGRRATILIGFLAVVNYRGVDPGGKTVFSTFSSLSTKVLCSAFCFIAGLAALALHPEIRVTPATTTPTSADWFEKPCC